MKRIHIPAGVTYRYRVLNPSGKNKGFRVQKFEGEKFVGSVKENPALDAINDQFVAGTLTKIGAREQIDLLVEGLYRADGVKVARVSSNPTNLNLFDKFIKEKYTSDRLEEVKDLEASVGYFRRAVLVLGELPLLSATPDEMRAAVNARYLGKDQHRIADSLNIILKWLGRSDALIARRKVLGHEIKFIRFDQSEAIFSRIEVTEEAAEGHPVEMVERAFRVMCRMALYTGLRLGELRALEAGDLSPSGRSINVNWQIDKNELRCWPKWGKRRVVAPFPEGVAIYGEWMQLKKYIPHKLSLRAARVLRRACEKAFPGQKHLHLCFHDLRHSYAIACLENGMNFARVAMNLGDTEKVVRDHYTGYGHTEVTVEQDFELLSNRPILKSVSGGKAD